MSDHVLAVLGLAVGILGVATGYYFHIKGKEKVDPRYMLTYGPLLGDSGNLGERVSLLVDGEEFKHLNRCLFALWNRGAGTLRSDDIVNNDRIRIVFPAGSRVLNVEVVEDTRKSIDFVAFIDEIERNVVIKFDFLDRGDGGVVQIIYQGDPRVRPEVTGSIRGVPEGIKMPALGSKLSFSSDMDEDGPGSQKGAFVLAGILVIVTYWSSTFFGIGYPLTVVLLTLVGELFILFLTVDLVSLFFSQSIGTFTPKVRKKHIDR